jgi:hypothetical protein
MKLGAKYLKAKDYAQVAAAGATVGALGYTPGEVGSPEWLKWKAAQTGLGAVGAPAMLGAGRGVSNQWRGGKNSRYGRNKLTYPIMPVNRGQDAHMNATKTVDMGPKTMGERGWEKFSNSPPAIGAALGGVGVGTGAYNSGAFEDFGDKTLRDWFGDEEPRDWQKWVNAVGGTILGGAGMRKVFKNPAVARSVIKGFGQSDTYITAKTTRRGAERMIMEAHVLPLAAKLEKLGKPDRELLWKMVTQEDVGADDAGKIGQLTPLKEEVNEVVHKLGRDLVDAGILNEKIWLQNKDKYLHRLYRKPNKSQASVAAGGFGFIGDEVRSRGQRITVQLSDWMRGKYDVGGSRNKKGHTWEVWEDTIKGKGWKGWKERRKKYLDEHRDELDDLYNKAYGGRDLTDDAKKIIRQKVKDDFLPDNLRS